VACIWCSQLSRFWVENRLFSPPRCTQARCDSRRGDLGASTASVWDILTAGSGMHSREAVQYLTQAVLQASGGELRDDATALCLDWHGGPPRDRDATWGANREEGPIPAPRPGVRPSQRLRRRRRLDPPDRKLATIATAPALRCQDLKAFRLPRESVLEVARMH
jgi:hypothetical protein